MRVVGWGVYSLLLPPTVCSYADVSQCKAPWSINASVAIFHWQTLLCLHPHSVMWPSPSRAPPPPLSLSQGTSIYLCIPQKLCFEHICCTGLRATLVNSFWFSSICEDPVPKCDTLRYWEWGFQGIFWGIHNSTYNKIPLKHGVWLFSKSFTNLIGFGFYFIGHKIYPVNI